MHGSRNESLIKTEAVTWYVMEDMPMVIMQTNAYGCSHIKFRLMMDDGDYDS